MTSREKKLHGARLERGLHRLFKGHWPDYYFAAVSDYIDMRFCHRCK